MSLPVPTEADEQKTLVRYLQVRGLKFFRVPNETYTKSWKQKANNKALGVVPGVPDLFVIVNHQLIAIEMKRLKGSTTSPAQHEWLDGLNDAGIPSKVCRGFEEAKAFVDSIAAWQRAEP